MRTRPGGAGNAPADASADPGPHVPAMLRKLQVWRVLWARAAQCEEGRQAAASAARSLADAASAPRFFPTTTAPLIVRQMLKAREDAGAAAWQRPSSPAMSKGLFSSSTPPTPGSPGSPSILKRAKATERRKSLEWRDLHMGVSLRDTRWYEAEDACAPPECSGRLFAPPECSDTPADFGAEPSLAGLWERAARRAERVETGSPAVKSIYSSMADSVGRIENPLSRGASALSWGFEQDSTSHEPQLRIGGVRVLDGRHGGQLGEANAELLKRGTVRVMF